MMGAGPGIWIPDLSLLVFQIKAFPDLWLLSKSFAEAKTKALFHILESIFVTCEQFLKFWCPV